jgi:hypothetical protein
MAAGLPELELDRARPRLAAHGLGGSGQLPVAIAVPAFVALTVVATVCVRSVPTLPP